MRIAFVFIVLALVACNQNKSGIITAENNSWKTKYLPLIAEVHDIECEHLKKARVDLQPGSTYDIQATAFQEIMKDPDRKMLARYEWLSQQLADIHHQMNDEEKQEYQKEVDLIYSKGCP